MTYSPRLIASISYKRKCAVLQMPSLNKDPAKQWVAIFIAFQTESWMTDSNGNPTA
jgi:uncharacterized protein YukJ